ncbi:MAG: hypothetical protein PWQ50_23 [Methanolobus sp.]|jgi:uncharacterized coiled-coil protein SlyX|nr:hypothetical protein [Methanolobus sp.]
MKMRIISSKNEISQLNPNEKLVHFAFRPSSADFMVLAETCPNLECVQIAKSYSRTLSKSMKMFLEQKNVLLLEGDIWGHRKDINEYYDVPADLEQLIINRNNEKGNSIKKSPSHSDTLSNRSIENKSLYEPKKSSESVKKEQSKKDDIGSVKSKVSQKKSLTENNKDINSSAEVINKLYVDDLKKQLSLRDKKIAELEKHLSEYDLVINDLKKQLSLKEKKVIDINRSLSEKDTNMYDINKQLSSKNNKITELEKHLSEKELFVNEFKDQLSSKDNKIDEISKHLSEKNIIINDFKDQLSFKDNKIDEINKNLSEKDMIINDFKDQLSSKDNKIDEISKHLSGKDLIIDNLEKQLTIRNKEFNINSDSTPKSKSSWWKFW